MIRNETAKVPGFYGTYCARPPLFLCLLCVGSRENLFVALCVPPCHLLNREKSQRFPSQMAPPNRIAQRVFSSSRTPGTATSDASNLLPLTQLQPFKRRNEDLQFHSLTFLHYTYHIISLIITVSLAIWLYFNSFYLRIVLYDEVQSKKFPSWILFIWFLMNYSELLAIGPLPLTGWMNLFHNTRYVRH